MRDLAHIAAERQRLEQQNLERARALEEKQRKLEELEMRLQVRRRAIPIGELGSNGSLSFPSPTGTRATVQSLPVNPEFHSPSSRSSSSTNSSISDDPHPPTAQPAEPMLTLVSDIPVPLRSSHSLLDHEAQLLQYKTEMQRLRQNVADLQNTVAAVREVNAQHVQLKDELEQSLNQARRRTDQQAVEIHRLTQELLALRSSQRAYLSDGPPRPIMLTSNSATQTDHARTARCVDSSTSPLSNALATHAACQTATVDFVPAEVVIPLEANLTSALEHIQSLQERNAALCAQLSHLLHGRLGVPEEVLQRLSGSELISKLNQGLAALDARLGGATQLESVVESFVDGIEGLSYESDRQAHVTKVVRLLDHPRESETGPLSRFFSAMRFLAELLHGCNFDLRRVQQENETLKEMSDTMLADLDHRGAAIWKGQHSSFGVFLFSTRARFVCDLVDLSRSLRDTQARERLVSLLECNLHPTERERVHLSREPSPSRGRDARATASPARTPQARALSPAVRGATKRQGTWR
eukprot:TRINITY_DN10226_c0_g1_i1.p1 TRINITY_DN10226_c0_g1~~TRINITY_DN10226_c0_g1_i1.p1  ORF type:complete len:526 (+),score=62.66 TRINITY_DN10226_c0_g1_i1:52-1629(+)